MRLDLRLWEVFGSCALRDKFYTLQNTISLDVQLWGHTLQYCTILDVLHNISILQDALHNGSISDI